MSSPGDLPPGHPGRAVLDAVLAERFPRAGDVQAEVTRSNRLRHTAAHATATAAERAAALVAHAALVSGDVVDLAAWRHQRRQETMLAATDGAYGHNQYTHPGAAHG